MFWNKFWWHRKAFALSRFSLGSTNEERLLNRNILHHLKSMLARVKRPDVHCSMRWSVDIVIFSERNPGTWRSYMCGKVECSTLWITETICSSPNYYPRPILLNFVDRTRTGIIFNEVEGSEYPSELLFRMLTPLQKM